MLGQLVVRDAKAARDTLTAALEEVRDRGSIWLELAVRMEQCEASGATRKKFQELKQVRAQLKESTDTAAHARRQTTAVRHTAPTA
jgi:hypothetical protein